MTEKKPALVPVQQARDPFAHYRQMASDSSFYRTVPLPDGVTLDDVRATFADGVLEVSVPLPARMAALVKKVRAKGP